MNSVVTVKCMVDLRLANVNIDVLIDIKRLLNPSKTNFFNNFDDSRARMHFGILMKEWATTDPPTTAKTCSSVFLDKIKHY